MAINRSRKLLTYDDYAKLPDDGKRYELIDGELALCPAPTPLHQRLVGQLYGSIWLWWRDRNAGELFVSPLDVVLDPHQVVQPDILYVSDERKGLLNEANLRGAPDLVVEVLSPGTMRRDRGRKRQLYDEFGVKEFWFVHQHETRVDIHRRGAGGRLVRVATVGPGGVLETSILPGLSIAIDEVHRAR